jgi:putative membrane protein
MPTQRSSHVTDHLANERTFLAWLRTSVAMMGFGVVIVRLRELAPQAAVVHGRLHAVQLGLMFALIGLAMMPFALWHYLQARRAIDSEDYRPAFWGIIVLSAALVALGFVVVLYLFSAVSSGLPSASTAF